MKPSLSVIIPVWNEARTVAEVVRCARGLGDEVIVVDAGSDDDTAALAHAEGAQVIVSEKGRGQQLHAGAQVARGDVLLFLHADARLPARARDRIAEVLADPAVEAGNFVLRFEPSTTWAARLFTYLNDARQRWMRIYYGDSALFVRREIYEELGGFKPLPIFEDYEFIRRLERRRRTHYVRDVTVTASARRFEKRPLWTVVIWTVVQGLYLFGVSPRRLARLYADLR